MMNNIIDERAHLTAMMLTGEPIMMNAGGNYYLSTNDALVGGAAGGGGAGRMNVLDELIRSAQQKKRGKRSMSRGTIINRTSVRKRKQNNKLRRILIGRRIDQRCKRMNITIDKEQRNRRIQILLERSYQSSAV